MNKTIINTDEEHQILKQISTITHNLASRKKF